MLGPTSGSINIQGLRAWHAHPEIFSRVIEGRFRTVQCSALYTLNIDILVMIVCKDKI